jgi:hypothetical protein
MVACTSGILSALRIAKRLEKKVRKKQWNTERKI